MYEIQAVFVCNMSRSILSETLGYLPFLGFDSPSTVRVAMLMMMAPIYTIILLFDLKCLLQCCCVSAMLMCYCSYVRYEPLKPR